jgi:hypothetical protein
MRREYGVWLAAAALAALLWCGCSGILAESESGGQTERLRLSTTDKWSSYDRNSTKQDESVFMLKKESTF